MRYKTEIIKSNQSAHDIISGYIDAGWAVHGVYEIKNYPEFNLGTLIITFVEVSPTLEILRQIEMNRLT